MWPVGRILLRPESEKEEDKHTAEYTLMVLSELLCSYLWS